jgi:hypothetical protein
MELNIFSICEIFTVLMKGKEYRYYPSVQKQKLMTEAFLKESRLR